MSPYKVTKASILRVHEALEFCRYYDEGMLCSCAKTMPPKVHKSRCREKTFAYLRQTKKQRQAFDAKIQRQLRKAGLF